MLTCPHCGRKMFVRHSYTTEHKGHPIRLRLYGCLDSFCQGRCAKSVPTVEMVARNQALASRLLWAAKRRNAKRAEEARKRGNRSRE